MDITSGGGTSTSHTAFKRNKINNTQDRKEMSDNGGNGGCDSDGRACNLFGRQKVNYPVNFDLKAIIESKIRPEDSIANMETLFRKFNIPFAGWRTKPSSAGKYISYTVSVEIRSHELLEQLYRELKKVPGLKFAL